MPELPEVQATLQLILPFISAHSISSLIIRNHSLRSFVSDSVYRAVGSQIIGGVRRAKYLLIQTSAPGTLVFHLGMSGSLRIVTGADAVRKHDHIDLCLANQTIVRYHDPRRFGALLWQEPGELLPQLRYLGPEPLDDAFQGKTLYASGKRRSIPIKTLIMDQRVVVGVGNIYAAEALFKAGIRPNRRSSSLSMACYDRVVCAIKEVLTRAIAHGGSSIKDFLLPTKQNASFQEQLSVYGRQSQACRCCGTTLKQMSINHRTTVYCPFCQT